MTFSFGRLVLAVVVAFIVFIVIDLFGHLIVPLAPIGAVVGEWLIRWDYGLALAAGIWCYFAGGGLPWPRKTA